MSWWSRVKDRLAAPALAALIHGCGPMPAGTPSPRPLTMPGSGAAFLTGHAEPEQPEAIASLPPLPPASPEPLVTPAHGSMGAEEAERYVLALVDRDRAAHGLAPLRWDETAAQAARRHARDLLAHGVTSHVGTDGSVPEQRYTEAGGAAMVWENVACFSDGEPRAPSAEARFHAESLAEVERAFLDEAPPHDKHRKNLLGPHHDAIGVGLASTRSAHIACLVQELVDDAGRYDELPRVVRAGRVVEVSGVLRAGLRVLAVGVSRVDLPRPRTPDELRPTRGYRIPSPSVVYQPEGYRTPIVLQTDSAKSWFHVRVPLGEEGQPGLYGISVWASFPGSDEPALVSLRTVEAY
jgi:uncharacterized protein YkwD